jgi:ATP-binding cassette subfamily B protein
MKFLRQFYQLLEGNRLLLLLSISCGLAFAGASLLPPLLIRELILWLTEEIPANSGFGLPELTVALLAIYAVKGLTRYGYGRFSHVAAYHVLHRLMVRTYRHVQRLPHRFFTNERTGNLIARSVNDVEAVEDFIAHGIPETVLALVIPTAMMAILFTLDPELALITLLPIPVAGFFVYRYVRKVRSKWHNVRSRLSELVAQIQDNLSGITVIKSFVQENAADNRIERRSRSFRDASIEANMISLIPSGIVETVGGIGIVLVILSGGTAALSGRIALADLFVFILYVGHIYQPFLTLASINDVLQKASVSTDRVFQLLAVESDIVDSADAVAPNGDHRWDVMFRNVTFGYDPGQPVVHEIDFAVGEGQIVALVGHTGAGKTTLSSLLPRYYDPQQGSITIGDYDVRKLQLDYVRSNIATVQQDVFLFHGTVLDNILFGRPEASRADVEHAAEAANADEFICELPEGYNTVVGERGMRLSGGQKQRLSIARALLKNSPILIFDEATSSVDTRTELLIQQAVSRLLANRTTLVIAHRLSTVRNADRLIVMDEGRIAESGSHVELLSRGGLYSRMIEAQELVAETEMKRV